MIIRIHNTHYITDNSDDVICLCSLVYCRRPKDLLCLGLFIAFIIGMFAIAITGIYISHALLGSRI